MSTETKESREMVEAAAKNNQLSTQVGAGGVLAGMESVADSYVVSYIKIIQSQTGPEWKPPFKDGDVVLTPDKLLMLEAIGDPESITKVHFAPVFLFPEYTIHNPLGAPGVQFIRERSFDRNSEIYHKCKLRDMKERRFVCPEYPEDEEGKTQYCTYSEHINICFVVLDHPDIGYEPIIASLHSGEWLRAQSFIKLLRARAKSVSGETVRPHVFQHRFQMSCSLHRRKGGQKGSWFGLDMFNPEDGQRFIDDEEMLQQLSYINKTLEDQYNLGEIETFVDDDSVIDGTATEVNEASSKF